MTKVVTTSNKKKPKNFPLVIVILLVLFVLVIIMRQGIKKNVSSGKSSNLDILDLSNSNSDVNLTTQSISTHSATNYNIVVNNKKTSYFNSNDYSSVEINEKSSSEKETPQFPIEVKHFNNEVDNQLEIVSRNNFGSFFTPYVNMSDEEALAYLKAPIEILETDDDKTIQMKERTAAMKTEALAYIQAGNGNLNDYLRDYASSAKEASETIKTLRIEMRRILHDEGEEAARLYIEEVNPQLQEAGLPLLKLGDLEIKAMERYKNSKVKKNKD